MAVVADNIGRARRDGTVDKLIVVRVDGDEVETESGVDQSEIPDFHQFFENGVCDNIVIAFCQNLMVFKQYLIGHAKDIFAHAEGLPNVVVVRPGHNDIDKAICVEDSLHLL